MESVGQLTGGVAHDFNNLLTVVIGSLDGVVDRMPVDLRASVDSALRAADRGAGLIRQLLAFSRRQMLSPETVNLNELAVGMDDLLRRTLGEHVEIEMTLHAGAWPTLADKGQVENALLNLAINARDAMSGGGKLTIETGNVHLDEDYAAGNPEVTPGGMTGRQLAEVAQRQRPSLKTLYTSGYTEDSIAHQGKLDPGVHFLSKPFRRQDLALKVRAVLDAA